ncbi:hypothetical protein [Vibrio parahaemolyticus]|uniref:hypothetical protein n=1 Tax=Vibrio parahaemolyticus TaxID=670 RepID=UPI001F45065F|nr:hypothetical protein [Vibrio parahaemolyticus]UJW92705.1 hypothetical protein JHS83_24710 [Vibrio parahaemolyticus]
MREPLGSDINQRQTNYARHHQETQQPRQAKTVLKHASVEQLERVLNVITEFKEEKELELKCKPSGAARAPRARSSARANH